MGAGSGRRGTFGDSEAGTPPHPWSPAYANSGAENGARVQRGYFVYVDPDVLMEPGHFVA